MIFNSGKEDDLLSAYAWIVIVAIRILSIVDGNLVHLPFPRLAIPASIPTSFVSLP